MYTVPSNINDRLSASLRTAINSANPLKSRGFGNPSAYTKVTNRGGRVDIDIFIDAAEYLLYVSEGTGANSNDPSQSVNTNKRGIIPRNILSAFSESSEFEEIVGDLAQDWLDWYFTMNDIDDIPAGKFPQIQNIFINNIEL
jgi:hypothetical protein